MTPELNELTEAIMALPGIGRRSAQRIAFYLVGKDHQWLAGWLARVESTYSAIALCERCAAFHNAGTSCPYCSADRNTREICVVESFADLAAIESTGSYSGTYLVLGGVLSPIDGIAPSDLNFHLLEARVAEFQPEEVIVATNPTVQGNATAHFIKDLLAHRNIVVSRLATGLAMGSQLDFADSQAISQSIKSRFVL